MTKLKKKIKLAILNQTATTYTSFEKMKDFLVVVMAVELLII